jgi:hypothetical protein
MQYVSYAIGFTLCNVVTFARSLSPSATWRLQNILCSTPMCTVTIIHVKVLICSDVRVLRRNIKIAVLGVTTCRNYHVNTKCLRKSKINLYQIALTRGTVIRSVQQILMQNLYRVIKNDCRGFNNLSYTIYLR